MRSIATAERSREAAKEWMLVCELNHRASSAGGFFVGSSGSGVEGRDARCCGAG
jgi:hypothetical protein